MKTVKVERRIDRLSKEEISEIINCDCDTCPICKDCKAEDCYECSQNKIDYLQKSTVYEPRYSTIHTDEDWKNFFNSFEEACCTGGNCSNCRYGDGDSDTCDCICQYGLELIDVTYRGDDEYYDENI